MRKPCGNSELLTGSKPQLFSEPTHIRNPARVSELSTASNPEAASEPIENSNPRERSGPHLPRSPLGCSEPPEIRRPPLESEPFFASKPSTHSEPISASTPSHKSKSSMTRKPNPDSEPLIVSNPTTTSEPDNISNPIRISEPPHISKPSSSSESEETSNPQVKSEPLEIRKPVGVSEPPHSSNPKPDSELEKASNPEKLSEPEKISKPSSVSGFNREAVRNLVEVYYDVQDVRIRSFNRLRQVGEVKGVNPNLLKELEKQVKDYITHEIKTIPIYKNFLKPVKGIGPILSGGILAWLDPHKADHASSFWKYCGLHVVDGKAIKRQKGKKLGFNVKMRVLAWKIAKSFVRQRTPFYREIYDKAKLRENEKLGNPIENPKNCSLYEECAKRINQKAKRTKTSPKKLPCKMHVDNRAMRKMVKRFLADLWVVWRRFEGLPVSEPYAIAILGHNKETH